MKTASMQAKAIHALEGHSCKGGDGENRGASAPRLETEECRDLRQKNGET